METMLSGESALWAACRSGDAAARERLIEGHLVYARTLAARMYAGRIDHDLEFEDYLQFATIGLIESVDRYDPDLGAQFRTFASHRINGAILNGIENMSEKRVQISTRKRIESDRRDSAAAALTGSGLDVFQKLAEVAVSLAMGFFLEQPESYENLDAHPHVNLYSSLEMQQLQKRVQDLVHNLPQKEKMVVKYHYLNQVPFSEIAEIMGLTKGRVSQIHTNALALLRKATKSVRTADVAW